MSVVESSESALQKANSLFIDELYEDALKNYNLSVELDEQNVEALLKRSACNHKLEKFTDSLQDANTAIKLKPQDARGYLRKGIACFSLEEYESAKSAFQKGQQIEPENALFKTWIRKCNAELDLEDDSERSVTQNTNSSSSTTTANTPSPATSATPVSATTTATPAPSSATPLPTGSLFTASGAPKTRHEWYQNATHVIVTVFAKNIKKEDAKIDISERELSITIQLPTGSEYHQDFELFDKVVPAGSSTTFLSTKVEIKLQKATQAKWKNLENTGETPVKMDIVNPSSAVPKPKKNWDKIVDEDIGEEKLDGDAGLNKVFQDIYSGGSEEQRRAMIKSFVESGGTVLSTNWDEVGSKTIDGTPPEGLEMRKWNE